MAASSILSNAAILRMTVGSIGASPLAIDQETGETTIKGEESDHLSTRANFHVVELFAVVAFVSGGLTFYYVVGGLFDLMSITLLVISPIVAVQKVKLRKLGGFRGQHNRLREQVGLLHKQNNNLKQSIDELGKQNAKLKQIESNLAGVAKKSGTTVDRLVEIVQENGKIQQEIQNNLQAEVIRQLMTAILQTDADRNFVVSPREVEVLIVRLQNIPGIQLDEAAFRSCLASDEDALTLADVCNIARDMKNPNNAKQQHHAITWTTQTTTRSGSTTPRNTNKNMDNNNPTIFRFVPNDLAKKKKKKGGFFGL
jgi:hypothetical protein